MNIYRAAFLPLLITSTLLTNACDHKGTLNDSIKDAQPYVTEKTYTDALNPCATIDTTADSCSLDKLPTLGMEYPNPTIDNVMERVIVSHQWMGERFEQLLQEMPGDILQLLGGVTAIVIDDNIRPSYYTKATGAIYLDPANLWLNQTEQAVISRKEDFRADFADPMSFRSYWRYVKDNDFAYTYYGLDSPEPRGMKDIVIPMASLLYHELAHANDALPVSLYDEVNRSESVYTTIIGLEKVYLSATLSASHPLTSEDMMRLAKTLFEGETPSEDDKRLTASEVGELFESDGANDDYAYRSNFEDFAMLVEETMMKHHFGVDRDIAYYDHIESFEYCDELKVSWGARNRIADVNVKARAQMALEYLLPNEDYSATFNALDDAISLPTIGLCESIDLSTNDVQTQARSQKPRPFNPESMRRLYKIHY